ncbi:hypothetical protein [Reinekea sp.]|uniref:hypothetical protein n=1 Tax=Reinekea sp. TaxID=1970455 RepID=UPI003989AFCF
MNERRQHQDKLVITIRVLASLAWLSLIVWQVIVWLAAPEQNSIINRYHELEVRSFWLEDWAEWLPWALGACTLFTLAALFCSPFRSRRKNDPKRVHLLILLALTLFGFWFYWSKIITNLAS